MIFVSSEVRMFHKIQWGPNPINTRGVFLHKSTSVPQNSKTANAITLKLGNVSQICIRNILHVTN